MKVYNDPSFLIYHLFTGFPESGLAPPEAVDRAVRAVSIDAINLHAKNALADPRTIDEALQHVLDSVAVFMKASHPHSMAFVRTRFYLSIARATRRQFHSEIPQFHDQVGTSAAFAME